MRILRSETVITVFGVATALAGHGAGSSVVEWTDGHHPEGLWWWLLLFVTLTLIFYSLYENPLPQRLSRRLKFIVAVSGAVPWLLGAFAVVIFYAVATGVHRLLAGRPVHRGLLAIETAVMAISIVAVYLLRSSILIVHTRYLRGEPATHEGGRRHGGARVIVGLLSLVDVSAPEAGYRPSEVQWSDPGDLNADLDALVAAKRAGARRWPWEMLLRALRPHASTVKELILIGSRDTTDANHRLVKGSLASAPAFMNLLSHYPELRDIHVSVWAEREGERATFKLPYAEFEALRGFNFSDLDEMSSAVADLLKFLRFERRIRMKDVMIDFTGGQKPTSVVAAAVTLRADIHAQYVDTNDLVPTTYDLVMNQEVRL